jgi:D-arabinose 1-dehydrogenase-like Zn-dependent alcohol dehydrogenase
VTAVRAATLRAARRLVVVEVELPEPRDDEVVVDVDACGICATNLHGWREPRTAVGPVMLPGAHGHELAGRVRGSGERVCLDPALACACGRCDRCEAGDPVGCRAPSPLAVWGFADAVVVPRAGLVAVPATSGSKRRRSPSRSPPPSTRCGRRGRRAPTGASTASRPSCSARDRWGCSRSPGYAGSARGR